MLYVRVQLVVVQVGWQLLPGKARLSLSARPVSLQPLQWQVGPVALSDPLTVHGASDPLWVQGASPVLEGPAEELVSVHSASDPLSVQGAWAVLVSPPEQFESVPLWAPLAVYPW